MEHKIFVYNRYTGHVTIATFLGNDWWITNKDEKLVPLYEEGPCAELDYRYLCEVGEMIQMRDIAGLMGAILEIPEVNVKEELTRQLKELNMMGVKFVSSAQYLNLDISVFSNESTKSGSRFCVTCHDMDLETRLFYVDTAYDAKEALNWAKVYVEFFLKHGVKVNATLHCNEDVLEQLSGEVQNMKIEIEDI